MGRNNKKKSRCEAIPEKQCDEYTRYRRLLSIDGALNAASYSGQTVSKMPKIYALLFEIRAFCLL